MTIKFKNIHFLCFCAVLLTCILTEHTVYSQEPTSIEKEGTLRTTKEFAVGFRLHTRGLGVLFRYGWQKNYKYKHIFDLDLTYIKHPKEVRSKRISFTNNKAYYFGKLNAFWQLRPMYGGRLRLFPYKRENGVEISWVWAAGFSLGLAKPVYLKVRELTNDGLYVDVQEKYDPAKHNENNIYGGASWGKGLNELKAYPGIHAKSGFYFDFTFERGFLLGAELGGSIDVYFQKIPIMANTTNQSIYPLLYLNIFLGQKKL